MAFRHVCRPRRFGQIWYINLLVKLLLLHERHGETVAMPADNIPASGQVPLTSLPIFQSPM